MRKPKPITDLNELESRLSETMKSEGRSAAAAIAAATALILKSHKALTKRVTDLEKSVDKLMPALEKLDAAVAKSRDTVRADIAKVKESVDAIPELLPTQQDISIDLRNEFEKFKTDTKKETEEREIKARQLKIGKPLPSRPR